VVHIGVDTRGFRKGAVPVSRRRRRVLFVGRLVEKKGCEFLLQAMAITREALPDVELTVVGDGPERPKLERIADDLGIRVRFSGALGSDDVKKEFDSARVFCLPSVTAANGDAEGLPIVLLESQAKGVPVVTSARGMAEGILDGKSGYCVAEKNVSGLANALLAVLSDDALSEEMSETGPAFVRDRFDILSCTRQLENYYNRVVGVNVELSTDQS
jgi:glycosyltransferase involved in cell wall biosynthesis